MDPQSLLDKAFAAQLRQARKAAKLSQEQLAFKAHLHRTYISLLERGRKSPTLDAFFRICESLGQEPEEFISQLRQRLVADEGTTGEPEHKARQEEPPK